jgi:hypothetical protein
MEKREWMCRSAMTSIFFNFTTNYGGIPETGGLGARGGAAWPGAGYPNPGFPPSGELWRQMKKLVYGVTFSITLYLQLQKNFAINSSVSMSD